MSFSDPLVCSGISGRSSTRSTSALLACRRPSRRSSVAKPVRLVKIRSKRARNSVRRRRVGLGDRASDRGRTTTPASACALGGALMIREGVELMDQSLRMPPESMRFCGAVKQLPVCGPCYCRSSCRDTSARMWHAASHPGPWSASAGADEPRVGSIASAASWQNAC